MYLCATILTNKCERRWLIVKYCLRCGEIVADNSTSKDRTICSECSIPYEEDNMTGDMFESLSESEKQKYSDELFVKIKKSDIFDEKLFNEHISRYGEASLYESWWYDKAKELGSTFCLRYETDEEIKQRIDREYGKDSPAYQQAIVEKCIQTDRARKQNSSSTPKCPSCGSSNVSKIGVVNRVVSTTMLGLASSKIGKTHKCKNCGTTW